MSNPVPHRSQRCDFHLEINGDSYPSKRHEEVHLFQERQTRVPEDSQS
jgi:hypothetical protein